MRSSLHCSVTLLAGVLAVANAAAQNPETEPADRVHGAGHEHDVLEEVIVTATPLRRDVLELSQSATVLSGAALERELNNTIGETLARMPGIANASFGQNVGRPVIRGLQGARIGMLTNNMASGDASAVSQDHAVPIEPFLADQIEVLRGPATLLYGSGSIGGVVNMVMHTIPEERPQEPFSGRAMTQFDSAADQRFGAARLDLGAASFAAHASVFVRRTDDYEIPGEAERFPDDHGNGSGHDEDPGDAPSGVLKNSFLDNEGGALGGSWIGDRWRFGLAWSGYDSDYGIPGAHGHHEEEEDPDDGEDVEHEEGEDDNVTIGLESRRVDAELVGENPFGGFERAKLRVARSDYEHTEFEGDEIGTVFTNDTTDVRLELRHAPWGRSDGAFGVHYTDRDFGAAGDEAFVPSSTTRTGAVFWVESLDFGGWQLDIGARYEDVDIEADAHSLPEAPLERSFSAFSGSLGAVWHIDDRSHLTFNFSGAERAPTDQELFAFGPHIATQTFEIGSPDLGVESNLHMEGGYRIHAGRLTGSIAVYTDAFSKFIYQRDTGLEEDGLPVRVWAQQDADFHGGELEIRFDAGRFASGHWQLSAFGDAVRGELGDGSDIPRMPPYRIGLGIDWDHGNWVANLSWIRAARQDRTAEYETETPGYDLLNADVSYLLTSGARVGWEAYFKAQNLLDEEVRHSTSFLKDQAPQIGRNFVLGVRMMF